MRKVKREEILDYETYGDRRDAIRAEAMADNLVRTQDMNLLDNIGVPRTQLKPMVDDIVEKGLKAVERGPDAEENYEPLSDDD